MSAVAQLPRRSPDSRAELRLLFRQASFGLAEIRPPAHIIPLNPALERMLGVAPGATVSLEEVICSEGVTERERLLRELLDGDRHSVSFESRSSAESNPLRWTVWRVVGRDGGADATFAIADESTDAQLEQRLRQAERLEAVGRLAGGVAHDFNNLLTGVLLYCDLLLANVEPGHQVRKYAEEIRNAGVQASALVRQLLAMSRSKSSEPCLVSLNEIVEGMRNLLVRLIGENIHLNLQLDPDLGMIRMDPTQAQQILLNLVLNARDAMPSGGTITVETSNCYVQVLPGSRFGATTASLPCAILTVRDNGMGMDAKTRAHLFDIFFTTKSAGKGSGLGLATVHDVVTINGGLIHVDSALERGTCVTVLLPLVSAAVPGSHLVQDANDSAPPRSQGENPSQ